MEQWKGGKQLYVEVSIEGQCLKMELDTGAAVSLLPYQLYQEWFSDLPIHKSKACLKTYMGEKLYPHGQITVNVQKGGSHSKLPLLVVDGVGQPLLVRNWLAEIPVNWDYIKAVTVGKKKVVERERNLKLLLSIDR